MFVWRYKGDDGGGWSRVVLQVTREGGIEGGLGGKWFGRG